jgi:deazaflavin-dependent oxidoreductase (nitroreductase family)
MDEQEMREQWERIKQHIRQYQEDPAAAHEHNPYGKVVPALLLTAKGRRTGKDRSLPLIYKKVGDSFVIVGSKGGVDDHPAWYKNLLANPDCHIQAAKDHYDVRARIATGAEREDLWTQMVELLPQYEEYQSRTERQIPIVVLDPRG